jgi:general secretion pathway protein G
MMERIRKMREQQEGFTLIELLIVIVILGILAAIVVFAVGGITDRGKTSACAADKASLTTAQEANFAKNGAYATEAGLVTNGFIHGQSSLYDTDATGAVTAQSGSGCS